LFNVTRENRGAHTVASQQPGVRCRFLHAAISLIF
jgi:hypothetical protein